LKPDPLPKVFHGQPKIVFTDVDETLTWQGRLPEETFSALAKLYSAQALEWFRSPVPVPAGAIA